MSNDDHTNDDVTNVPTPNVDNAYTVLNDGDTFTPLEGSKIVFAEYDQDDRWEELEDAEIFASIDLDDLLTWALAHGYEPKRIGGDDEEEDVPT